MTALRSGPRIFLCYRRDDAAASAGRLSDRLIDRFGRGNVFMDVNSIEAGERFEGVISQFIQSCDVALIVIGRNWLTLTTPQGVRRIDSKHDVVRDEIALALTSGCAVIPVLVDSAPMPAKAELPESIAQLADLSGFAIASARFNDDYAGLVTAIRRMHRLRRAADPGRRRLIRALVASGGICAVAGTTVVTTRLLSDEAEPIQYSHRIDGALESAAIVGPILVIRLRGEPAFGAWARALLKPASSFVGQLQTLIWFSARAARANPELGIFDALFNIGFARLSRKDGTVALPETMRPAPVEAGANAEFLVRDRGLLTALELVPIEKDHLRLRLQPVLDALGLLRGNESVRGKWLQEVSAGDSLRFSCAILQTFDDAFVSMLTVSTVARGTALSYELIEWQAWAEPLEASFRQVEDRIRQSGLEPAVQSVSLN